MSEPPNEDLHGQLWQLYADWFAAIPGDDDSFFRRVLADDWHYTNYFGEVRGKLDYLSYIEPIRADAPMQMRELIVRSYPPVVIVHGMYTVPPELAPPAGGDTRFTAAWIRRDGQWAALAHHATTVVNQT